MSNAEAPGPPGQGTRRPTAATFIVIQFDNHTQFPLAPGGLLAVSAFLRLTGGSLTGFGLPLGSTNVNAAGGSLSQFAIANVAPTGAPLRSQRFVVATNATHFTHLDTAFIRPFVQFSITSGAVVDCTLRIGWPQCEMGAAFASSPILPAAGAPGVSTRGADLATAASAGLGLGPTGRCTLLWSGILGQAGVAGANPVLVQIDDGSSANAFVLQQVGGGGGVSVERRLLGSAAAASLGTATPGTPFRAGVTIADGRIAGCLHGGAVQSVVGGPVAGLTNLRIGGGPGGVSALFGEVTALHLLPFALADSALPSAVAALST